VASPSNQLDPLYLFIIAFFISAMAGVAALLQTSKAITARLLIGALLNSGALGLGIALVLFTWCKDNTWFLLGLCLFAGLGGMTAFGFVIALIRQGGVTLNIRVKDEGNKDGTSDGK